MKKLYSIGIAAVLFAGCAHDKYEGSAGHDVGYQTGEERGTGSYGPTRPPTQLERDFPERIQPGATGEPRTNPLTAPPIPDYYEGPSAE